MFRNLLLSLFCLTFTAINVHAQTLPAPTPDWGYIIADSTVANLGLSFQYNIETGAIVLSPWEDFLITAHNYDANAANLASMGGNSSFAFPLQIGEKDTVLNIFDANFGSNVGSNSGFYPHFGEASLSSVVEGLEFNDNFELYYAGTISKSTSIPGPNYMNVSVLPTYQTLVGSSSGIPNFKVSYIAKLNNNGTPAWVATLFGGNVSINALKVDKVTGDAYILGESVASSGAVFTDANGVVSAPINGNYFIAKFTASGSLVWANVSPIVNTSTIGKAFDLKDTGSEVALLLPSVSGFNGWRLVRVDAITGAVINVHSLSTTGTVKPGDVKYIPGSNDIAVSFLASPTNGGQTIDIDINTPSVQNVIVPNNNTGLIVVKYSANSGTITPAWINTQNDPTNSYFLREMSVGGSCGNIIFSAIKQVGTNRFIHLRKIDVSNGNLNWISEISLSNNDTNSKIKIRESSWDSIYLTLDSRLLIGSSNSVSAALAKFSDTDTCP